MAKGFPFSGVVYASDDIICHSDKWDVQPLWGDALILFKNRGGYSGSSGLWGSACMDAVDFYCMVFCSESGDVFGQVGVFTGEVFSHIFPGAGNYSPVYSPVPAAIYKNPGGEGKPGIREAEASVGQNKKRGKAAVHASYMVTGERRGAGRFDAGALLWCREEDCLQELSDEQGRQGHAVTINHVVGSICRRIFNRLWKGGI